ncbi:HNH endonuclease signature motif containing protein [Pengzhenrongella sicca]|uniref:DUF222 domain-containing protein n=1 Tax=Pengzhenrongella sicca TaxID=2819238 RepID=A0A8A4ZMG2_9MICO|nr:HNH endonuclease signature motif containing protein [Pengzhenrongella sicca]QTE30748.1 DUF222 domain-containing protein [Pengzhenrongella sicca]
MTALDTGDPPPPPPPDPARPSSPQPGSIRPTTPEPAPAALAALHAQVGALAQLDPNDLSPAAAVAFFTDVFTLADKLHALAILALPAVDADGLWATTGARSLATWLTHHLHLTSAKAHRMTRLARALRGDLPRTAEALRAGATTGHADGNNGDGDDSDSDGGARTRVGVEQAEILAAHAPTSSTRRSVLAEPDHPCGEQFLLDNARTQPADALRNLTRSWAAAADPAADERGYREATEREYLDVAPTTGGYHLSGFLTTEHGQTLVLALDAATTRPATDLQRSGPQRRADALTTLIRSTLDHGHLRNRAKVRPHLNVLIDYPTLEALTSSTGAGSLSPAALLHPATFDDGQPVPRAVLDRLLCGADLTRVIFGPDSQLLDIGRTQRLFPARLHRAIIARDRHCQYPGCTAPARYCESHHTIHWARDHGNTDARTGVLLCTHHHTHVHDTSVTIRWNPQTRSWVFTDRHGKIIV